MLVLYHVTHRRPNISAFFLNIIFMFDMFVWTIMYIQRHYLNIITISFYHMQTLKNMINIINLTSWNKFNRKLHVFDIENSRLISIICVLFHLIVNNTILWTDTQKKKYLRDVLIFNSGKDESFSTGKKV